MLIVLCFGLLSCTEQAPVSGTIEMDADGQWTPRIFLIDPMSFDGIATSYRGNILDSALIDERGNFAFEEMPDAPEPVLLQLVIQKKGERYLNKLENDELEAANYFPILWQNGSEINISAEAAQFQNSLVINDPSPENEALLRLRDIRLRAYQELKTKVKGDPHEADQLLAAEKARLEFQRALMDFAEASEDLLPALVAIRWVNIAGDYERIPEFIFGQCQHWKEDRPDHPWVAQLCEHGRREVLPVLQGDIIPDFPLPMLSGDTLALHQLLGNKLTLLDLWASWCAPCRRENREVLVPLWEKYQGAGFQIIGYALDASPNVWKGAIEKDGADRWQQASHLQGDDSPFFTQLRISTIPANFLLDAEGRVVGKNLHGAELTEFVRNILGK
ncbi:MAG: TlpA disulfide reductase family protein [Saprospiraceae bacterium]